MRPRLPSALALVLLVPGTARAGMPTFDLTEVASLRLQAISFFAVVLLACAFAIQRIWNSVRTDFPWMPRISYARALGLVALWGLAFLLVLTMISGARELMTPGAWKKDGATYKLAAGDDEPERRARLEALRVRLWAYASQHGGELPPDDRAPEIPDLAWRVVEHPSALRYVYVKGRRTGVGEAPVAYEPAAFGRERLVLLASGEIARRPAKDLAPESPR